MPKFYYVYSGLGAAVEYVHRQDISRLFPVLIRGGKSGLDFKPDEKHPGELTVLTEEQMDYCNNDGSFVRHKLLGYILVSETPIAPPVLDEPVDIPLTPDVPLTPDAPHGRRHK